MLDFSSGNTIKQTIIPMCLSTVEQHTSVNLEILRFYILASWSCRFNYLPHRYERQWHSEDLSVTTEGTRTKCTEVVEFVLVLAMVCALSLPLYMLPMKPSSCCLAKSREGSSALDANPLLFPPTLLGVFSAARPIPITNNTMVVTRGEGTCHATFLQSASKMCDMNKRCQRRTLPLLCLSTSATLHTTEDLRTPETLICFVCQ